MSTKMRDVGAMGYPKKRTITSIGLTSLIVLLLILSGPAAAVKVTLKGVKTQAQLPDDPIVEFNLTVELQSPDQYVPMQYIELNITGAENRTFRFDLNGNVISGTNFPDELVVTPNGSLGNLGYGYGYGYDYNAGTYHSFGYGYGYGYADILPLSITYNIKLNTSGMSEGSYTAIAYVITGNSNKPYFASKEVSFTVTRQVAAPAPVGVITPGVRTTPPDRFKITIGFIAPGETKVYNITGDGKIYFTQIVITAEKWIAGVTITGETVAKPSELPAAPGEVLAYIDVSTVIKDEQVSYVDITFRVPKAWLEEKGIAEENVALYRYTDAWVKLSTSKVGEDSSYVYYRARSPGFSYFAIAGEKVAPPPPTAPPTAPPTTPPPTAPPTTPPPTTPAPVTPAPTTPAPTTPAPTTPAPTVAPPGKPWVKWVVALVILAIIVAAAYYYTRKR